MKLLLTSAGITNDSLKKALKDLVGEEEIKSAFIPTASNIEDGKKDWLIEDYVNFQKFGYIDIIDISAIPRKIYLKRLKEVNVIIMGGGDTTYLMKQIEKTGFDNDLKELLKDKVYVGISAGSIVMSKKIWASSEYIFKNIIEESAKGLGYININFRPHYNSKYYPKVKKNIISKIVSDNNIKEKLYVMDDNSGLKIINGKIEIISEGKWELFD